MKHYVVIEDWEGDGATRPGRRVLRPHLALIASSTPITRSDAAGRVWANRSSVYSPRWHRSISRTSTLLNEKPSR